MISLMADEANPRPVTTYTALSNITAIVAHHIKLFPIVCRICFYLCFSIYISFHSLMCLCRPCCPLTLIWNLLLLSQSPTMASSLESPTASKSWSPKPVELILQWWGVLELIGEETIYCGGGGWLKKGIGCSVYGDGE